MTCMICILLQTYNKYICIIIGESKGRHAFDPGAVGPYPHLKINSSVCTYVCMLSVTGSREGSKQASRDRDRKERKKERRERKEKKKEKKYYVHTYVHVHILD